MLRASRRLAVLAGLAVSAAVLPVLPGAAAADDGAQPLPFNQDWSSTALITANDNWSAVPGIIGYLGDYTSATTADVDPRSLTSGATTTVDVIANQAAPNTLTAGGVSEFEISNPVVALQGSGTADAPNLVVSLDTRGKAGIQVAYELRDIDGSADNAAQQVALQFRVGTAADWTNVPGGYVADATTGPSLATLVTPVAATLPARADDQGAVQLRIITTNATGSDEWVGVDALSVTASGTPSGPASPVATCPANQTLDVGTAREVVATAVDADSRVDAATVTVTMAEDSLSRSGFSPSASSGQSATATVTIAMDTPPGSYAVNVAFSTAGQPQQSAACDFAVTVQDPNAITPISVIQGTGPTTPLSGERVNVDAIVTSRLERADVLDGFFLQEELADQDGSPATSEGVFVFCRTLCPAALAVGDRVRVGANAGENFGMTQVNASLTGTSITVRSSGNALPPVTDVALPAAGSTRAEATFEPVEGMIARFPATLTVSEYFELARFGQLTLTAGGRPYQHTHSARPSTAGYAAFLAGLNTRRIILDDDNNDQNDAITGPAADEPYAYPSGGLSTANRFRGGDTISGLTGVLHWSFNGLSSSTAPTDAWRVRPVPTQPYVFESRNPRPAAPDAVGGRLRAASFNVLNYFTTIDTTSSGSTGPCGPSATLDCRGADSAAELALQRAKIVDALARMDADVVGLIEIQNDADVSLADLVAALNADGRAGTYDYVRTGTIGGDAIKVAFIYRPARVSLLGAFQVLDSSDDPRFVDTLNRPALVQTFREVATGETFTAAINHFKSKGSPCSGDPDVNDGAGNCNQTRTQAARALADFLATDPTRSGDPDVLVFGDLNAYKQEDPIVALEQAGYTDLVEEFGGEAAYGYLFDGQLGYLDHALAGAALLPQVTGATEWHVNADEPVLLDYNDQVLDAPGEASFDRESAARPLYEPNAFRSSDHDAVVVGLALSSTRSQVGGPAPVQPAPASSSASASPSSSASASTRPAASTSVSASPAASTTTGPSTTGPSTTSTPAGPPPAPCTVPATVTLERTTITAGGAALVTVRATPDSVLDVLAYTQPSRTFRIVRSAELGGDGVTEIRVVPPANTRLYAQQRGCPATDARGSSVVVNVRTALSIAVTRTGTRRYLFSGDSLPARPGGLVISLFRVTSNGRQVLVAQTRADSRTGSWQIDRRFSGTGRFGFVVRTGQDLQHAPGTSNVRSVLVF